MRWFTFRRKATPAPVSLSSPLTTMREPSAHITLDGRRYVNDAPYILPKDLGEINRLDFQHYMLRHFLHGNYGSPLRRPAAILDVGSGTGRWPIQMAREFPDANVISLDLEPPQQQASAVMESQPDNCVFVPGNVLNGLPFPDGSFDFVHQRLLIGAIPAANWPTVVRELVRVTRLGGWIELVEAAPVPDGGPALEQLRQWMITVTSLRGLNVLIGQDTGMLLQQAGLAQIQYHMLPIPIGTYGGHLGQMAEANYMALLQGLRPVMIARKLTDDATFDHVMQVASNELLYGRYLSPYYLAFGQRVH